MPESSGEVRVGDFFHAEDVEHSEVLACLLPLELGDSILSVVNSQEVNELLVVVDVLVGNLDGGLKVQDVIFLLGLGLEDALECSLALAELF